MYPNTIQQLIEIFSRFPGVGPKTAARFVFYLKDQASVKQTESLIKELQNLKQKVKVCQFCFNSFEGQGKLCPICQDPTRDLNSLCVVEKEQDLRSIENTGKYLGLYFILGGTRPDLKKEHNPIREKQLRQRIKNPKKFGIEGGDFREIILGLNPTPEGKTTMLYLKRNLKDLGKKITSLGLGLPKGGELEYADQETLSSALESRR